MTDHGGQAEGVDAPASLADPAFLAELRSQMLRFATLQLSDATAAEDAVQEALIGALKNATSFNGRAALKTWVFAILKNKIADTLRRRHRLAEVSALVSAASDDEVVDELFDKRGMWKIDQRPADWGNPEADALGRDFWRIFELCLDRLPSQQGRVFMMREFIDMETSEICREVGISTSNLNVMLHRARLRLRECLEDRWFATGVSQC